MELPIERVKKIILSPKTEWPVIAAEPGDVGAVYRDYVLLVAAVPAIAVLVSGVIEALLPIPSLGFGVSVAAALVSYGFSLGLVALMGLIVSKLAPSFSGRADYVQAVRLMAYASTPAWVVGALRFFEFIPSVGLQSLIGLLSVAASVYAIYLIHAGLPSTLGVPENKTFGFTMAIVAITIVPFVVLVILGGTLIALS